MTKALVLDVVERAAWPTAHKGLVDLAAAGMLEEHAPGVLWQPISAEALAVLREDK